MIIVRANARNATYISDDLITSGSVGIQVTFNLSEDFDGLSAIAVFEGSGTARDVALIGDSCVVPHEVLTTAGGYLRIGIYASNSAGTIVIPTVWAGSKMILQGTEPSEVDPSEPTPSWVAQVQGAAAEALANSEEAIEIAGGADAAAEEARHSASAAAASATAAGQSASAAGTAQEAAEAAQMAAASARDAAVAAQGSAESSAQTAAGSATAAAGSAAAAAASEAAAREVEESIPQDYTALSENVSELKSQTDELFTVTNGKNNLASDIPGLPFLQDIDSASNQVTLYNSYSNSGAVYVPLSASKAYLSIIRFTIGQNDTSTQGTARLVITKKDTSSTEPMSIDARKDVYMSTAQKGSSQYVYCIGTVPENTSIYYKLVSYSSGTASRHYHITIAEIIAVEFNTVAEAKDFAENHISEITQYGWRTAIDLDARENIKLFSQLPYNGKTCCVIGDSLSASYYDMWCSYFTNKTHIALTNLSIGGTSVAVRSGRTDSFVERVQNITDEYDLWIVFGGMNDKDSVTVGDMTSTDTSTFYGAYKAIINNIQGRSNHPILIMVTPYHNVDAIVPYIEAIREIAKFYGIPLVDLAKISGVNPSTRSIYTRDWTHPNQLLCDRIRPQITRELCDKIVFPESTDPMPN